MSGTCKNCKYWVDSTAGIRGSCIRIGDGPMESAQKAESDYFTDIAYTADVDGYHSELFTVSTFGCNLFEPGEPVIKLD